MRYQFVTRTGNAITQELARAVVIQANTNNREKTTAVITAKITGNY